MQHVATGASLLVARTPLVALGISTNNKKLLVGHYYYLNWLSTSLFGSEMVRVTLLQQFAATPLTQLFWIVYVAQRFQLQRCVLQN